MAMAGRLALVVLPALLAAASTEGGYVLSHDYSGPNFFDHFDFWSYDDPTHGYVDYVTQQQAQGAFPLKPLFFICFIGLVTSNILIYYNYSDYDNIFIYLLLIQRVGPDQGVECWRLHWRRPLVHLERTWPRCGPHHVQGDLQRRPFPQRPLPHADWLRYACAMAYACGVFVRVGLVDRQLI
jgi:hypothetical protein